MGRTVKKDELAITSIDELKQYAGGAVVEFPPFDSDQPFIARVKRPSLLAMAQGGRIPNELLEMVNEMFTTEMGDYNTSDKDLLKNMGEVIDMIASDMFIEPTYEQIKELGIELTDDQRIFLFNYSQTGVKSLKLFRPV